MVGWPVIKIGCHGLCFLAILIIVFCKKTLKESSCQMKKKLQSDGYFSTTDNLGSLLKNNEGENGYIPSDGVSLTQVSAEFTWIYKSVVALQGLQTHRGSLPETNIINHRTHFFLGRNPSESPSESSSSNQPSIFRGQAFRALGDSVSIPKFGKAEGLQRNRKWTSSLGWVGFWGAGVRNSPDFRVLF